MDLPNLFSAQKNGDTPEKVIGILLSQTKVQALLLSINKTGISVDASSDIVEYTDSKNCMLQTDEALQQLGKGSEKVDSVVFGLDHDWILEGEVKDQHKPLLRQLTTELDLKPVGFIDTSEALVHHHLAQNSLYSGILVLLSATAMTATYVSQGKIRGVEHVGRSDSIVADLREGLARFSKQVEDEQFYLPAKLSLASLDITEEEMREMRQEILDFNWPEHARFLQIPTIEILSDEQFTAMAAHEAARAAAIASGFYSAAAAAEATAVSTDAADATSKEMGFTEVTSSQNQVQNEQNKVDNMQQNNHQSESNEQTVPQPSTAASQPNDSEPQTAEPETAEPERRVGQQGTQQANVSPVPATVASSFGVPISSEKIVNSQKTLDELDREAEEEHPSRRESAEPPKGFLAGLRAKWNEPYKGGRSLKFFILTGFGSGLVVLMLVLTGMLYFMSQAEVMVKIEPLPISKDVQITLDSDASEPNAEEMILPAHTVTKTVSGQDTTASTGVAIVGDQATGKVTIYNKTTAEKSFDAGTTISTGELEFTLDDDVTIASASVTEKSGGEEKEYGSAEVGVTAADIGADFNVEEGTEFTVANFATSTYAAEAAENFSGGASREVQIVSTEDRQRLLQELRADLLTQANEQLKEEATDGEFVAPTTNITSETPEFSAEVEDEVTEFALNLEITVSALSYRSDDLKPIAEAVLESEIPENYILSEKEPSILSDQPEEASGSALVAIEANISSFADPVLDSAELASALAGKPTNTAIEELQNRDEIAEVRVAWKPALAKMIRDTLPSADKINIVIE